MKKPAFKHHNKDNSIFKDYLLEPRKKMLEKIMNSRLFKAQESSESESKKNNVKDLLELFSKKVHPHTHEAERKMSTHNSETDQTSNSFSPVSRTY